MHAFHTEQEAIAGTAVHGARPLEFKCYYYAQDGRDGELGFGWCHSYMISQEATMLFATVTLPDGVRFSFIIRGGGNAPMTICELLLLFPLIETSPPEDQPLVILLDPDGLAGVGEVRFQLPYELVEALGN